MYTICTMVMAYFILILDLSCDCCFAVLFKHHCSSLIHCKQNTILSSVVFTPYFVTMRFKNITGTHLLQTQRMHRLVTSRPHELLRKRSESKTMDNIKPGNKLLYENLRHSTIVSARCKTILSKKIPTK